MHDIHDETGAGTSDDDYIPEDDDEEDVSHRRVIVTHRDGQAEKHVCSYCKIVLVSAEELAVHLGRFSICIVARVECFFWGVSRY